MKVLRTYARIHTTKLDQTLEGLAALGLTVGPPVHLPGGLVLASAERALVVAGTQEQLRPFAKTSATLIVDDLAVALQETALHGAVLIHPPQGAPTGITATIGIGDVEIELVEWSAQQWDRVRLRELADAPEADEVL